MVSVSWLDLLKQREDKKDIQDANLAMGRNFGSRVGR
jgi:hypothetical protein